MTNRFRGLAVWMALALAGCVSLRGEYHASSSSTKTEAPAAAAPAAAPVAPQDSRAELIKTVESRFDDPRFSMAFWGVLIQSLGTGEIWYERNADRLFMPASNEKILTTAATLMELGPDFRFETTLYHAGAIKGSTIDGNLVVFGNGDPTLYEKFFKDSRDVFRKWAGDLKALGINRVTGDIVGDDNAFDDEHIGRGWSHDGLDSWSSAEFGALELNEDYIDFKVVAPETADGAVTIVPNLPSSYYRVVNNVKVATGGGGRGRVSCRREYGTNTFVFSGSMAPGAQPITLSPTITNPTLFYVTVLKEVLIEEGIAVDGRAVDCDDMEGWKVSPDELSKLATHRSPPLSEILKMLMKRSQNMYAETMVHVLGWKRDGVGTFRGGRAAVQERLAAFGAEPGSYVYADGSGLTRYDLVSPRILVKVLTGMRQTENAQVWLDGLPIAGVDGTLRNRMKETPAQGNVRAKTGTISNVRGLSGYVTTADGEELVFSFLVNSHLRDNAETEEVTDGVLALLAGYKR